MFPAIMLAVLIILPTAPRSVHAMGRLLSVNDRGLEITCSNPVMKSAPTFLSYPKGSAKYPFTSYCTSPGMPGAMTLRWEGSWNPSETRQDRPNAVESITITAYEGFLPMREPGGKIFLYWTGRCDKDPWLQPSTCDRFGSYVPPDVRDALTQIDHQRFPLTWKSISTGLKQQLINQYQAANTPIAGNRVAQNKTVQSQMITPSHTIPTQQQRTQAITVQPQQPQVITQSQAANVVETQPQSALPKTQTSAGALARSGIFSRGTDETEGGILDKEGQQVPADAAAETTDSAVIEERTPEIVEPVALELEQPFHSTDARGEAVELKSGSYEVGSIMDLQLGLAKEGQSTVLLNANQDRHSFPIHRTLALVIPGPSDDIHLLYLTTDGRRFDAIGFPSAVKPRKVDNIAPLPDKTIEAAVRAASISPRGLSSPPCRPNPSEIGPRWVPVPCTIHTQPHQPSGP